MRPIVFGHKGNRRGSFVVILILQKEKKNQPTWDIKKCYMPCSPRISELGLEFRTQPYILPCPAMSQSCPTSPLSPQTASTGEVHWWTHCLRWPSIPAELAISQSPGFSSHFPAELQPATLQPGSLQPGLYSPTTSTSTSTCLQLWELRRLHPSTLHPTTTPYCTDLPSAEL